ncbi:Benzoyl-CoA reductase/2-hydroxyglutaryl-CoA dehydratase subunit, BcrC/BadD/HgdB [Alkalispirochaeta americana]|uniref:Benzoyl-CoA reductase/2-hydroxyglutaryl-CoA dehydratase subunit, BcrC/BadD/HgdB n=1 Tax=Alkalispirochaeta americana TaxID=159291 RepID=A0A1N6SZ95_9SPIO|nr:2-hydroxyacyl-CoA dehydratase family protein [Alkalispirochaeta americana]SIQ46334.1 Benzoyl-CoA reductase/2-hydroxyglutaryl-CoA dehydratase subunit, BcrC/BadD/HgdB [Alkalispirochaeta americana]
MAEEVRKKPAPPDPDSARFKLGAIIEKHYREVHEAKARGEKIGWCASNFPQEIFQTLGVKVCYPENQAAAIAARGAGQKLCEIAESEGYSNDICAYARISLAYTRVKDVPEQNMPLPDFLLCCNNICNCMIKWYENLAEDLDIPLILIDIPFNTAYEPGPDQIAYVRAQFMDAISQLERITGTTWSEDRFRQVMEISNRSSRAWLEATGYTRYKPSPLSGFDLLNHMAVAVCARGTVEAAEAFETLIEEYKEAVEKGTSTFRAEEKHRFMFEGIACWPHLRTTFSALKNRGMNMVATIYADAFGQVYQDLDGLIRGYCSVPNAVNLEKARDTRIGIVKKTGAEGLLVHTNRSCKLWSGFMQEMSKQIGESCDIPVVSFDGDQADPRNFSAAQYETRVQGLAELMEVRKKGE